MSGAELVGVGGRLPGTADRLADAVGAPDLPLTDLAAAAEGLVVAVPPSAAAEVIAAVPAELPLLVESPPADIADRPRSITAVNLLHAPVVARGLQAIAELGPVHHLQLRGTGPRPSWGSHGTAAWGGGVAVDPHSSTLPVLLAAAAAAVTDVRGSLDGPPGCEHSARLDLALGDGRTATARLAWTDDSALAVELEAASDAGVATIRLLPTPELERDGRIVVRATDPPLVALGFVAQMQRFVGVVRGDRSAWPPLAVGAAVTGLVGRLPEPDGH